MDLLLHVGYPKTGTTTLQKECFTTLPGYVGSPALLGYAGRAGHLKGLSKRYYRGQQLDLDAWRTRILGLFGDRLPERVVISSEGLLRWDAGWVATGPDRESVRGQADAGPRGVRLGMHPFAGFLRDHVRPAWQGLGAVRVLITLRNQSDWFPSFYAQMADRIVGASQRDFERQVRRIAASGDGYLDYADVVDSFQRAVGADHVLVLLIEDMADDAYWHALEGFVGAELRVEGRTDRLNQRSTEEGWLLGDYDRAQAPLRRALVGWRTGSGTNGLPSMGGFRNPAGLEWLHVRRRGAQVRLTDELRSMVRARYSDSSRRLGRLLGRDLTPFGY